MFNRRIDAAQNGMGAVGFADFFQTQNNLARMRCARKRKADFFQRFGDFDARQFFKLFYALLHLGRLCRIVAEAPDKIFGFTYFFLLKIVLGD